MASVYEAFWKRFFLGDDFMFVSVFSAELGSSADTFAWDFTDFFRGGGLGPCGGRRPVGRLSSSTGAVCEKS